MATDKHSGQYLDALSNMLFIGYILENLGDIKLCDRIKTNKTFDKVTNLLKYLKDFRQELDDFDKEDLDISVLIGMTEISYAILLVSENNDEHQEQKILKWYKDIFHQIYSPRYIKIEISQIDFLLEYITDEDVVECLNFIKTELENFLKH